MKVLIADAGVVMRRVTPRTAPTLLRLFISTPSCA
jgi:hypothetical protein